MGRPRCSAFIRKRLQRKGSSELETGTFAALDNSFQEFRSVAQPSDVVWHGFKMSEFQKIEFTYGSP